MADSKPASWSPWNAIGKAIDNYNYNEKSIYDRDGNLKPGQHPVNRDPDPTKAADFVRGFEHPENYKSK